MYLVLEHELSLVLEVEFNEEEKAWSVLILDQSIAHFIAMMSLTLCVCLCACLSVRACHTEVIFEKFQ